MITGRIRALTKPSKRLEVLAHGVIFEVIAFMDIHLDKANARMHIEPPPKAGSKYVRTHTYRNSWHRSDVRLTKEGLVGTLSSDAVDPYGSHYSVLVGGDDAGRGQLSMHAGTSWPLMAEVLRTGYAAGIKRAVTNALS